MYVCLYVCLYVCMYVCISHVLNGCMEFKNLYVARHNRIVKLIGEQIAADKLDFKIHCDKIVKLEMFVRFQISLFHFSGSTTEGPICC